MLICLIYASTAHGDMSNHELIQILEQARVNNEKRGVVGMLLYRNRNFLQVLEGEETEVKALFEKIRKDVRHHHVELILQRPIDKQEFKDWQMGFVNLERDKYDEVPGYSNFLSDTLRPTDNTLAYIFLKNFRDMMR
ncbi:MAG: BLUF domain-containing protein [Aggregatilineales bacterium]